MEFHRGRLIDHILIVSKDLKASRAFYETILGVLDIPIEREGEDWFMADELFIKEGARSSGKIHLAMQAASEDLVKSLFEAGIEAGGKKKHAPAYDKAIHPFYFSAAVLDPDGNVIEAVSHGPIKRSSASVTIKPSTMALLGRLF